MRISGLLGAVIALSVLTPIAPARADISSGDLMYTDLFKWQGQDGTPTWREILANFDGTEELTFYLWNVPSPPPPVVIPATTPVIDPVVAASSANPSGGAVDGDATSSVLTAFHQGSGFDLTIGGDGVFAFGGAVPEPSTWAMMLLGFGGLGAMARSRRKQALATA